MSPALSITQEAPSAWPTEKVAPAGKPVSEEGERLLELVGVGDGGGDGREGYDCNSSGTPTTPEKIRA